ncbi:MAG: hypothetical protein ACJART_000116 [Maribacter sp.]|jgi:hypothetical protein
MADENKDLGDEAKDALDNAKKKAENLGDKAKDAAAKGKEEAKNLGDKAEEAFDNAKEKASDFSEDAKEKASDFTNKAEEAAKDFKEDVKETFDPNKADNGKTVAIIAHITFIGTIVAFFMNNGNKTELGSYYIRQLIGIYIMFFLLSFIPLVGCFTWVLALVLIVMSVINAANEKMVPTPLVGEYFQDWFKGI